MEGTHEIEVKLAVEDLEVVRRRLESLGARFKERVEDERDLLFRPASDTAILQGEVLRLRLTERGGVLAWKGRPEFSNGVKRREERQTEVSDPAATRIILERLGFEVNLEYSKSREYWDLRGLTVSLDSLPFGLYVEVEGDEARIEAAVSDLGLSGCERVEEGYPQLAARYYGKT